VAIRHKRDTDARRKPRAVLVAGPIAFLATAAAVTIGVTASSSPQTHDVAAQQPAADLARAVAPRAETVSRAGSRVEAQRLQERFDKLAARTAALRAERAATLRAVKGADRRLWTTTLLNLWSESGRGADKVGLLEPRKHVLVTGRKADGRVEVVVEGKSRWVTAGYLAAEKPEPPEPAVSESSERESSERESSAPAAPAGLSMAPCPDPGVESGLTSDAVYVYRSVCNAFPQITSYGGWDGHGEHASGRAIDIMTSDAALGTAIAEFLRAHAAELNLYDIIWRQQIWTPERASEGWRSMPSRGSATADHYDHVHVATNG
jgi:hypothetical protein